MENAPGFPGPIPSCSLIKSLLKIDGKWPWLSLEQFLDMSLLNPYQKSMENDPGASRAKSFRLPYQTVIDNLWKMLLELTGPIP